MVAVLDKIHGNKILERNPKYKKKTKTRYKETFFYGRKVMFFMEFFFCFKIYLPQKYQGSVIWSAVIGVETC